MLLLLLLKLLCLLLALPTEVTGLLRDQVLGIGTRLLSITMLAAAASCAYAAAATSGVGMRVARLCVAAAGYVSCRHPMIISSSLPLPLHACSLV